MCHIDFNSECDLAYTKPIRFVYFGKNISFGNSWTDLYVSFVAIMCRDYPNVFVHGMSFSYHNSRVELAKNNNYGFMFDAKPVPGTDFMLETNISATNIVTKIKYILKLCEVDFENVAITYQKKDTIKSGDRYRAITQKTVRSIIQKHTIEKYEAVLEKYFFKGFRTDSPLEIRKFRRYYQEIHEAGLDDSDDEISDIINDLCIIYEKKAFLPKVMLSDEVRDKLFEYIETLFREGKIAIYYQAIYDKFSDDFLNQRINNTDMLKAYLEATGTGRFYVKKAFISKKANVTVDFLPEIRTCMLEYARPVEYDELFASLPHISKSKIKSILSGNDEFVRNGQDTYFHEGIVRLSDEEIEGIAEIISQTIEKKFFIGGNELYDAIKIKYSYIIDENKSLSVYGFRDALKAKLGDRFSFKGNIISHFDNEFSMADVFAKYAQTQDSFTLSELQGLATNLATEISFDAVYENSLRISKEQFVSKTMAQFAVSETDDALDRVCVGKYIPLCEVQNFGIFPYAGFAWNSYLLEHYVASYSNKYKLLHRGFSGTKCVGAIVRRSVGIDSFNDLIVDIIVNNSVELEKSEVLQYLSDKGYLAQRRYSEIESLIIKAKAQKQRENK